MADRPRAGRPALVELAAKTIRGGLALLRPGFFAAGETAGNSENREHSPQGPSPAAAFPPSPDTARSEYPSAYRFLSAATPVAAPPCDSRPGFRIERTPSGRSPSETPPHHG